MIGFVGGFVKPDDRVHSAVQLAEHLRNAYPTGVYVRVFENHHGDQAYKEILRHLDADNDGTLSPEEKQQARIIIYGHSWGASETVTLARKLEKERDSGPAHDSSGQCFEGWRERRHHSRQRGRGS